MNNLWKNASLVFLGRISNPLICISFSGTSTTEPPPQLTAELALAAKSISCETEKARTIKQFMTARTLSDEMISSIVECIGTMDSAKEKCDLLEIIAKHSALSENQFRIGVNAINNIKGTNTNTPKTACLLAFCSRDQFTAANLAMILTASETISSSSDKFSIYTQLIRNRQLGVTHFPLVLKAIGNIGNDSNKSELLCQIAPRLPTDNSNLCGTYVLALNTISSSEHKAMAALAFVPKSDAKGSKYRTKIVRNAEEKGYRCDN